VRRWAERNEGYQERRRRKDEMKKMGEHQQ
jgi:hypothetical protein